MEKKLNVFGFSIVNSAGFDNGNESKTFMFQSQDECLKAAFASYSQIWDESEEYGVLEDDSERLSFESFKEQIFENGYFFIQLYDAHVQFEYFSQTLELTPEKVLEPLTDSNTREDETLTRTACLVEDIVSQPNGSEVFWKACIVYMLKEEDVLSYDELLRMADRIYEAQYCSAAPLLTAERVDAVRYLLTSGVTDQRFSGWPSMSEDQVKEFLLTCDYDIFIDFVETVAVDNETYYLPDDIGAEREKAVCDAMEAFVNKKPLLNNVISEAGSQTKIQQASKNTIDIER